MFSFHKPKVYRSSTGCCICKAKSSSSRFTDSKKYEEDFLECFQLSSRRQGEICNACVLLVKRWKKLPDGPKRNWRHVVDARAGPGMKSMTKFKSKQKKQLLEQENNHLANGVKAGKVGKGYHHHSHGHGHHRSGGGGGGSLAAREFEREFSPALSDKSDGDGLMVIGEEDYLMETGRTHPQSLPAGSGSPNGDADSGSSSRTHSPAPSDCEDNNQLPLTVVGGSRRRKAQAHRYRPKYRGELTGTGSDDKMTAADSTGSVVEDFIDMDYWKRESICCGTVYRGRNRELLIDRRHLKPCTARLASKSCKFQPAQQHTTVKTVKTTNSPLLQYNNTPSTAPAPNTTTVALANVNAKTVNNCQQSDNTVNGSDNSSDSGYDESSNPLDNHGSNGCVTGCRKVGNSSCAGVQQQQQQQQDGGCVVVVTAGQGMQPAVIVGK